MILISRSILRQFRSVLRHAGFYKTRVPRSSGFRIISNSESLRFLACNGRVAVEFQHAGQFAEAEFSLPISFLSACEGKSNDLISLDLGDGAKTVANWHDDGVPQQETYAAVEVPETPAFAQERTSNPPTLLGALRDAIAVVSRSPTRYALDCLQLKGSSGTIVATDSRQLLLSGGFTFPWDDDVLLQTSGVFASKELPSNQSVEIGRTDDGVTFQIGPWTIHQSINKEGRYPDTDRIIPADSAILTRMRLDDADADILLGRVERLPGYDLTDRPVTLDLNGSVIIRARSDGESPTIDLVLSRSQRLGEERRLCTNRDNLAQAIRMGFREVGFVDETSPCVCREPSRIFIWVPLEKGGILPADPEAIRIESAGFTNRLANDRIIHRGTRKRSRRHAADIVGCVVPMEELEAKNSQRNTVDRSFIDRIRELRTQLEKSIAHVSDLLGDLPQLKSVPRHILPA